MERFRIGTLADWFNVGLLEGIKMSERVGAEGVQLYAMGELDPMSMTPGWLGTVRRTLADCRQEVAALCGELGGHGLCRREENPPKLEYLRRTLLLARELDCSVVTTHLGVIPAQRDETYMTLLEACRDIGRFAAGIGACVAVETGPEPVERLRGFCLECGEGIRVNYDPANLAMVLRADPVAGVYAAGDLIVHTHAKDGLSLKPTTAEYYYGVFAEQGIDGTRALGITKQVPLGEGAVKWPEYLRALRDIGYAGFLTIERESKEEAGKDIAAAVTFLRERIAELEGTQP
ncbi:MAG TPA: sugar phosphate isomerase/epimerase [Candidatus Limnocylindria bacterium]|nr:sugar phosphate isomerase/epimerase [Candidatus Limnocylindria bacterium]